MENQVKLMSLYDYLGKAAGGELGLKVNTAARKANVERGTRIVSNPKYTGNIFTYPKDFLDGFFQVPNPDELYASMNDDGIPS